MPATTPRLPRARTRKNPEWLDALAVYRRSFDASSADALTEGAEAFAEMSPDDQAFHQAHLAFRQVQALGDVFAVLRRIEARLAALNDGVGGAAKNLPVMRKALVTLARGQEALLGALAEGGSLEAAVNGDDDDAEGDEDDDDDFDAEEDAEEVEDEDHGGGDAPEVVVPDEIIPASARREPEGS
jgi:hypothetical protein